MDISTGRPGLMTLVGTPPAPPATRMENAQDTQDLVRRLIAADSGRARKRALVAGVVDGNPPYSWRKLREQNRADACNVNWGTGRSYLEAGAGAFYDLFSQAPGFVSIETSYGTPLEQDQYSRILSREFDSLLATDADFDNDIQLSQNETVLYGTGPMFFEDPFTIFPIAVGSGDLIVPERARSKTSRWELSILIWDYYPPELYQRVEDEEKAAQVGWNPAFTKEVIKSAMGLRSSDNKALNWEFYQQQLKSNSLSYISETKVCKVAHVFWKEFTGRVTHAIVQRENTARLPCEYLFVSYGRYANFNEAVHPMYYDKGRGGFHHNVTGLGIKQYGAIEYENRLLGNLMDKTFAPKTLFKPLTPEAAAKFQLARFSDYAVVPPGTDVLQNPIQGFLADGLAMFRTSSDLMRSNLSSYRQPVAPERSGNPPTKFQKELEASQMSSLSGTTFNRYYKQLDGLYKEMVRRACDLNTPNLRAQQYQKTCMEAGVPRDCFGRIRSVKAVRVIGQGSPFMRQQVTEALTPVIGRCSEDGQNYWLNDYIASHAGQAAVERYNPQPKALELPTEQRERAMNQVAAMKIGLQPTVVASQSPVVFAGTFLQACVSAIQSVQQGANPTDVLAFLDIAAPAAAVHIRRLSGDVLRKDVFDALSQQWEQVARVADQLRKQMQQQAGQQRELQGKLQGQLTDQTVKAAKAQGDYELKKLRAQHSAEIRDLETRTRLAIEQEKARQQMALADAETAAKIRRNRLESEHTRDLERQETEAALATEPAGE